ncbi:MAG: PKD domain-containing protein, partial [Lentimicrobium sp.]|nr:PKD domain-containing protein [Lentimicrobium sp.]
TQTATNLAAGTYSVTVSDGNCSTVATGIVIGIGAPTANVSTTNANCGSANGTATVTASGGSGTYTYQWDANAGNQTTQTATNLPAGTYDVTVSDGNCSTIATGIVNETGAPTIVISQSNDNICEGQSVTLIASGADSYTWSPATGLNTTTGNTVIATPPYTITYTVEGSTAGCSAFESARIIVNPAATADFSYVENNLTVDFTNLSMNALTYNWDFGDGNSTNLINPSHSYAINGSYNVELTATNDCSSDTITLLVDLVTGINKIDADNNWSIYPNPTTGMIMFGKSLVYKVILTNSLGAVLETKINVDAMDLSGYPGGIYYLSFISENGSVSNHKIIILR